MISLTHSLTTTNLLLLILLEQARKCGSQYISRDSQHFIDEEGIKVILGVETRQFASIPKDRREEAGWRF